MRQWKQWCTEHKEDKSPTDVVSSHCHADLYFLPILKAFSLALPAKYRFCLGCRDNFDRVMFCAALILTVILNCFETVHHRFPC